MKILVSGASGLVGARLVPALRSAGHEVSRLVRERAKATGGDVYWNPAAGEIDQQAVDSADAIINLSGESIASGRWTQAKKQRLLSSRIDTTRTLAKALARQPNRPRALMNASAIGYYGDRGDERLTEDSTAGSNFLAEICRQWEAAAQPAVDAGARVVFLRFGVILSGEGGALQKMLLPFRLGLGGKIGDGRQYMSWIAIDDVVGGILYALTNETLRGPVNFVSPQPLTNLEFTKTLGRVLGRPTIFPLPAFAAKLAMGQMGQELLLASQRVEPKRLLASGYSFAYPQLKGALAHVLGQP